MLVLSRKLGESIQIGDQIRITVLKIDRNGIRLGIEAPREIAVVREELLEVAEVGSSWTDQVLLEPQPAR